MPAASIAPIMLVEHAMTVENAGIGGRDAGVHQHFARDVAPRQVGHDRAPDREVRRGPVQLADHVPHDGHGKADRVVAGERTIGFRERRPDARGEPDICDSVYCPWMFLSILAAKALRADIDVRAQCPPRPGSM